MVKDPLTAIAKAIALLGGQSALAQRAGLSQQHISKLLAGERRISAEVATAIEAATKKKVTRQELRPDLWPPRAPRNQGSASNPALLEDQ